ncbi:MAG: branched-chain amino acid ABC transporter permease [Pseudomonadota bacterium]
MTARGELIGAILLLGALALGPAVFPAVGQPFLVDLAHRLIIVGIAAVSLNLILGYGGMVSFGHMVFFGIGAYAVGIPAYYDDYSAFSHLVALLAAAGAFALITGAMSLRTKGVHFIMITMAFAQMAYFLVVSMEEYGADDGLILYGRSEVPGFDLGDDTVLYYVCLTCLILAIFAVHRIVGSRFGMVLQGARSNDRRMQAMGFPTFRYRLVAYVIAALICALAGFLEANRNEFISPDMMDWTRSGELIFMVVLGGTGRLFGPLFGVTAFILLEEYLEVLLDVISPGLGVYWHLPFGLLLILVVLFVRGGISGLMGPARA